MIWSPARHSEISQCIDDVLSKNVPKSCVSMINIKPKVDPLRYPSFFHIPTIHPRCRTKRKTSSLQSSAASRFLGGLEKKKTNKRSLGVHHFHHNHQDPDSFVKSNKTTSLMGYKMKPQTKNERRKTNRSLFWNKRYDDGVSWRARIALHCCAVSLSLGTVFITNINAQQKMPPSVWSCRYAEKER